MSRAFDNLARSIEVEYEEKGYTHPQARYIGRATVGKIARRKAAQKRAAHGHKLAARYDQRKRSTRSTRRR